LNKCVIEFYTTNVEKDTVKRIKFIHFLTEIIKQIRKVAKKERHKKHKWLQEKASKLCLLKNCDYGNFYNKCCKRNLLPSGGDTWYKGTELTKFYNEFI
jgi:hypothetical protein